MNKAIEKLKEEFGKIDYRGQAIINNCLLPTLKNDPDFEEKILNDKKSVKGALEKIESWVRKSKNHTPSHDIIFSAVLHYYQEDKPQYVKEIFQEEKLEFGNIEKEFNTPIIKYITGTIVKVVETEVYKQVPKKQIAKKVKDDVDQLSIFEV